MPHHISLVFWSVRASDARWGVRTQISQLHYFVLTPFSRPQSSPERKRGTSSTETTLYGTGSGARLGFVALSFIGASPSQQLGPSHHHNLLLSERTDSQAPVFAVTHALTTLVIFVIILPFIPMFPHSLAILPFFSLATMHDCIAPSRLPMPKTKPLSHSDAFPGQTATHHPPRLAVIVPHMI